MNNQKLRDLLQDEKFVEVLGGAKTNEEVQEVFKDNGLDVSKEEIEKLAQDGKKAVEDGALEEVSGGGEKFDNFKAEAKKFGEGMVIPVVYAREAFKYGEHSEGAGVLAGSLVLIGAGVGLGIGIKHLIDKKKK